MRTPNARKKGGLNTIKCLEGSIVIRIGKFIVSHQTGIRSPPLKSGEIGQITAMSYHVAVQNSPRYVVKIKFSDISVIEQAVFVARIIYFIGTALKSKLQLITGIGNRHTIGVALATIFFVWASQAVTETSDTPIPAGIVGRVVLAVYQSPTTRRKLILLIFRRKLILLIFKRTRETQINIVRQAKVYFAGDVNILTGFVGIVFVYIDTIIGQVFTRRN